MKNFIDNERDDNCILMRKFSEEDVRNTLLTYLRQIPSTLYTPDFFVCLLRMSRKM